VNRDRYPSKQAFDGRSGDIVIAGYGPGTWNRRAGPMSNLAKLSIWNDPAIRGSLSWHPDVAENRRSAKFRIAATIAMKFDPAASSGNALWAEFDRLTPVFLARWQVIRTGARLAAGRCRSLQSIR
jgi:hypothetical protein